MSSPVQNGRMNKDAMRRKLQSVGNARVPASGVTSSVSLQMGQGVRGNGARGGGKYEKNATTPVGGTRGVKALLKGEGVYGLGRKCGKGQVGTCSNVG